MQEIVQRQSRRNRGEQPELQPGGPGAGAANNGAGAAADAAAMAAAGEDTEEDGNGENGEMALQPPPPLQDVAADPGSLKPPTFSKWDKPTRDPEALREHAKSFIRQARRSPWYRGLRDWLSDHCESHGITTFDEWVSDDFLLSGTVETIRTMRTAETSRCCNGRHEG